MHVSDCCNISLPAGVGGAAAIIGLVVYIVIGSVYCFIGLCMLMCSVIWFVFVVVVVVGSRCVDFDGLSIVCAL